MQMFDSQKPAANSLIAHLTEELAEADRLMTVCNSCRYCEGLCAVFPAMELRRTFTDGDLNYLANLCHGCGACYVDCQFSPPHEFNVNVPQTLARVRADSWKFYAWPKAFQPMFERNGLAISVLTAISIALFFIGFAAWHDPQALVASDGRFYRLMPHNVMAVLFGAVSLYAMMAMIMGFRNFWRDTGNVQLISDDRHFFLDAARNVLTLRYLDGGGDGCFNEDEQPKDRRRLYHHFTFYGFMLCFAATCTATMYHYVFDIPAPYSIYQLPKIFGVAGGIALLIGTIGLFYAKATKNKALADEKRFGMIPPSS
jgi:citrate/tricarballylate utilization protein